MTAATAERFFRRFLLILIELMCVGTVAELVLEKHFKETDQFIPFVLCAAAFASVLAVLVRPNRTTIWILRVVMLAVILGSLLGGLLHLRSNLEFVELRPGNAVNHLLDAIMGEAPLLAPGILGLAGVLGLAVTYYHPALGKRTEPELTIDPRNA